MKLLKEILQGIEILEVFPKKKKSSFSEIRINGICDNSKEVKEGYVFVARKGVTLDGKMFIKESIERGAQVIVSEEEIDFSHLSKEDLKKVIFIKVKDICQALSKMVLNFYDHPQKNLILVGVTGTNGKTSVCYFTKTLLNKKFGIKTGYIGTIFYEVEEKRPALETTPSILKIAPLLKEMVDKNFKVCVMEVSSHALDQQRILGLLYEVAGFTNLSRDHLDYHKTMEAYYQAKKRLFLEYLKPTGKVVISLESEYGKRLYQEIRTSIEEKRIMLVNDGRIKVEVIEVRNEGLRLKIKFLKNSIEKIYEIQTSLFGEYQAKNLATTIGILNSLGFDQEEIIKGLETLKNPIGRLELVSEFRGAKIFVDYAHTPSALENVLKSLLPIKKKRLIVVFGCGGDRDKGKRPLMGEIAERLADFIILTSDNPRFEDPNKIIEDIKEGLNGTKPCEIIVDRREAIRFALEMLEEGDVLLIAGKGHENYQEIKGVRYPFSDQEEVLKRIRGIS